MIVEFLISFAGGAVGTITALLAVYLLVRPSPELSESMRVIREERAIREDDEQFNAFREQMREMEYSEEN